MASKRDYYELLGVERNASEDDIRRAFRRLARQYHPDVNRQDDAEERFKEVNEAYEVLSDTEKRQNYDRFGHDGPGAQGFGAGGMGGFGFEDIIDSFFGGSQRGGRRATRGADLRYNLTLTLEETVTGADRVLEIPRLRTCTRCHGSGAEPGTQPVRCPACNGSGEVRRAQQTIFGSFVNVTICERCRGEGQIVSTPCSECHGERRVQTTQRLSVNIPPGVDDGQQLRLSGEGESGAINAPAGDLYVAISVRQHAIFKRQGSDLVFDTAINVAQAALGDEIDIPTINSNPVKLKVPAGTQTGKVLRLRERGVPHLRGGGRGDQLVRIRVATPTDLNDEQRRLLRELARSFAGLGSESAAPEASGTSPTGGATRPSGASSASDASRSGEHPTSEAGQRAGTESANRQASKSAAENGKPGRAGRDAPKTDRTDKAGQGDQSGKKDRKNKKEKGIFEKVKDVFSA